MQGHCGVRSLLSVEEEGCPEGLTPSSDPPSLPGEESEVKPRGSTAERGWLRELLLQHKEMDTKMLEGSAMTLRTEWGKLPRS